MFLTLEIVSNQIRNMKMRIRIFSAVLFAMVPFTLVAKDKVLGSGSNLRVSVTRGKQVTTVKGGSIGEKLADFKPGVKIQNSSIDNFPGNRVCLIMMGEDTTRPDSWRVICRREFDADLMASKTFEWEGDAFQQGYDRTYAKSGYDYDGYILLIRNSEGKVVFTAQSNPNWGKDPELAWNLEEGSDYDKNHFAKK